MEPSEPKKHEVHHVFSFGGEIVSEWTEELTDAEMERLKAAYGADRPWSGGIVFSGDECFWESADGSRQKLEPDANGNVTLDLADPD